MANEKITISLTDKTAAMLKEIVEGKGLKRSAVIAVAIAEYYEKQKGVSIEQK